MRIWLNTLSVLLSLAITAGCDSSGGGNNGTGASGGDGGAGAAGGNGGAGGAMVNAPARQWERQLVQMYGPAPSIAVSPNGTIDFAYWGQEINSGDTTIVWQTETGTPEVIANEAGFELDRPLVARDASDNIHVVWASSGVVKYAIRTGGVWATETVALADAYRPDIALASDGTPHVSFIDTSSGPARAYHAVRQGGTWQTTDVNVTRGIPLSDVSLVLTNQDKPILAALNEDSKGVWVAEGDGTGAFQIETVGTDDFSEGGVDLAVGELGVAVAFKGSKQTRVGIRASEMSNWVVENVASFDNSGGSVAITMGSEGIFVVTDVDIEYPNGHAFLERTNTGWSGQLIRNKTACDGGGLSLAHDAAGEPVLAFGCGVSLYLMRPIGWYPDDWKSRCAQAAADFCKPACTCGAGNEECCWSFKGDSTCTSTFGCPSNAIGALCGDPTTKPETLQACLDELPTLTCSVDGPLDMAGTCGPLYRPFSP